MPLELELKTIVNCHVGRAASGLNLCAISITPNSYFFNHTYVCVSSVCQMCECPRRKKALGLLKMK